jgi:hypothetical protein
MVRDRGSRVPVMPADMENAGVDDDVGVLWKPH